MSDLPENIPRYSELVKSGVDRPDGFPPLLTL